MKKNSTRSMLLSMMIDKGNVGPIQKHQFGEEIVYIYLTKEESSYYNTLLFEGKTHVWMFDPKGKEHAVLMIEEYYEKFSILYGRDAVNISFQHFKNNNLIRKSCTTGLICSIALTILVSLIISLSQNSIIWLMIIIAILLSLIFYIFFGKLSGFFLSKNNEKSRERLRNISQEIRDSLNAEKSFNEEYIRSHRDMDDFISFK